MDLEKKIQLSSAYELGILLQKQKITPVELIEYYYDKIKYYSRPSPYSILTKKRALLEAKNSLKRLRENKPLSPLDGVPVAWKDLFDFKHYTTIGGSKLLENNKPAINDAHTVLLAKKAGLIQLGKTKTVEFALGGIGTNQNFKTPINAIIKNHLCVPGGSSSGSAIALANNLCAASFGTDTGGSVRIPAAWNKLIGLKTSYGRISLSGVLPLAKSYDTVGPLTKSVKDASIIFSVLTKQNYLKFENINPQNINILVVRGIPWNSCDQKIQSSCEQAIKKISSTGINIVEKKLTEIEELNQLLSDNNGGTTVYEAYQQWKNLIKNNSHLVDKNVLNRMLLGKRMKTSVVKKIKKAESTLSKRLHLLIKDYDALLMPTVPILPPKLDEVTFDEIKYDKYNKLALRNTRIINSLNLCAITLPCPVEIPVGLMLCMAYNEDERLLNLAYHIEKQLNK